VACSRPLVETLDKQGKKTSKEPATVCLPKYSLGSMDILGNKRLAKGLVFWPTPWRL